MAHDSPNPGRVLIAGAGIGGLEAALALRSMAGDRARVELLEPAPRFRFLPEASARALEGGPRSLPLAPLAERAGVRLRAGRLAAVDCDDQVALTTEGERIGYDRLIIAVGARHVPFLEGALTFAGPADVPAYRRLVGRMLRGARCGIGTRLTIVVPPGPSWSLPAYELALVTNALIDRRGVHGWIEISIVTSEDAPLAAFGPLSSDAVAHDLEAAGIELHVGSIVHRWSWGRLHLLPTGSVPTDRAVSLPILRGPEIGGLPQDVHGFIQAHPDGRVPGTPNVFVIGDAGPFPLKQGGIACQQADAVASTIAGELGAPVEQIPFDPVLRGWLWDGADGRFLRASLPGGRDESAGVTSRTQPLWQPTAKVAGRFLGAFLEDRMPPLHDRRPRPVRERTLG